MWPFRRRAIARPDLSCQLFFPPRPLKCPKCETGNIEQANFCRACGLMLKSHDHVIVWLSDQREMIRRREQMPKIEIGCQGVHRRNAIGIEDDPAQSSFFALIGVHRCPIRG